MISTATSTAGFLFPELWEELWAGYFQVDFVFVPERTRAKPQGKGPAIVLTNPLQAKPSSLCTVTAIIWIFLLLHGQREALAEVKPLLVIFPKTNP